MWDTKTRGDVIGLQDVVSVVPDFGAGEGIGEGVGDEVSGAGEGCLAIGCRGGWKVSGMLWEW